jgi:hypothetical protein
MLKKNKRPLILALGTGALLLGGALAYWLLVQQIFYGVMSQKVPS